MSNSSDTVLTGILVPLLFGTFCLGPFIMVSLLSLWLDLKPLRRIARIEYKLNLIAKHLGIEDSSNTDEVLRHLWNGNKINAIKAYKERHGVGLTEAKQAVDSLERGEIVTLERSNGTA
ncbi:MAG TPA: hypothetical protein VF510_22220 [Ktedonobacterales bacterium]